MCQLLVLFITLSLLSIEAFAAGVNHSVLPAAVFKFNNSDAGPVSTAMENLAYNTASITFQLATEVDTKLERSANTLRGNIEVIVASAMQKLAQPIYQAKRKLLKDDCQPEWTISELRQSIDMQLTNCTLDLNDIMNSFQEEANDIQANIQKHVPEIGDLPKTCELLSGGATPTFANSVSCFVERISDINRLVANELQRMNLALIRSRHLSKEATEDAEQCTEGVVKRVEKLLDESLQNC